MRTVIVQISDADFEVVRRHHLADSPGDPVVSVLNVPLDLGLFAKAFRTVMAEEVVSRMGDGPTIEVDNALEMAGDWGPHFEQRRRAEEDSAKEVRS